MKKLYLILLLVIAQNVFGDRPKAPFKVLYSNDTTNIYSCTSPYHERGYPFTEEALEASIDETAGTGVEVHMLQPGVCWVPWWTSTVLPALDHYNWFMATYGVWPDSFGNYMRNGGDIVQVFVERCRLKGIVPFISFRLNDGHRLENVEDPFGEIPSGASNNITQFYKENPGYRIGTDLNNWYQRVHNWAIPEVRNFKLAYIQEIIQNYDIDGFELDFMRMCSFFDTSATTSLQRKAIMLDVIEQVRQFLDDNTDPGSYKWLCVRVPGYVEAHDPLGIDLQSWVQAGVDMVNLSSYYFTDQQMDVSQIVNTVPGTPVYIEMTHTPIKSPSIPGVYDSSIDRRTTDEQFYTTAHSAYEQGAAGVSLFNFAYYREFGSNLDYRGPFYEPPFHVLQHLGDPNWISNHGHYYFMAGIPNNPPLSHRPLNSIFYAGQNKIFHMKMFKGAYSDGKLRIRCENSLSDTNWTVKLNGHALSQTSDVSEIFESPYVNYLGQPEDHKAWHVPRHYLENGDNTIEVHLASGSGPLTLMWIDLQFPAWQPDPQLDMNASEAGNSVLESWQPAVGGGSGRLVGKPEIKAYPANSTDYIWFYEFDSILGENDQVLDIGNYQDFIYNSACTYEAWIRLPGEINNSGKKGVIIGNSDHNDTGWRFGVRCDAISGKYSCEFQIRDNESDVTAFTGALNYRTANFLDYDPQQWVHMMFVKAPVNYNSGNIEMNGKWYVNGTLVFDQVKQIPASSINDFYFADLPVQLSTDREDMYFTGDISRVRIYDYALNEVMVQKLYSSGINSQVGKQCGKYIEFDFNQNCIFDIYDLNIVVQYWLEDSRILPE